ncbi:MAG: DUF3109 family protein [Rhizobacter sp.]|nr:DUF3109 family protein [Chlorobiales bacterium]
MPKPTAKPAAIVFDNVMIDDDILSAQFRCALEKCKGACCVEGDLGPPVTRAEVEAIERNLEAVKKYLPPQNLNAIGKQGVFEAEYGNLYYTTVGGRECVFATIDTAGVATCTIERAYLAGESDFRKPVSCHLFPIRVRKSLGMDHLTYMQIDECHSGRQCGAAEKVPLPEFVAPALRRKYGDLWTEKFLAYCRSR